MKNARRPQGGFTLVELMISLVLGLLIILALMMMLTNVNRNNSEMSSSNRLIENGRFATQLLASDIMHAGYWDGYVPDFDSLQYTGAPVLATAAGTGSVPTAVPDPCAAYSTWNNLVRANLVGIPVQSSDTGTASTGTAPFCSGVVTSPLANTDVLVVRHAETCAATVGGTNECRNTLADANPDVHFQAATCNGSGFVMSTAQADFTAAAYLRRNATTGACDQAAAYRRFASTLYYIKDNGTAAPQLMRSTMVGASGGPAHGTAQPIVDGVEGFRVEFGIDSVSDSGGAVTATVAVNWADPTTQKSPTNRGDGIPDGAYVRCTQATPCTPYQMMNAVAAKIYVLVRAEKTTSNYIDSKTYAMGSTTMGPFNDGYKRHLFTQTVRIVNVSGRRETPN